MSIRTFPLDEILSASTGRLVADRHIDSMYDLIGHVTGDRGITTIGIAAMAKPVREFLLQEFPHLTNVETSSLDRGLAFASTKRDREVSNILSMAACRLWVDRMARRISQANFDVPQMSNTQPRDMMDDIDYIQKVNPNAQIIPVVVGDQKEGQ